MLMRKPTRRQCTKIMQSAHITSRHLFETINEEDDLCLSLSLSLVLENTAI